MTTIEKKIDGLALEIFAPTSGFIIGVSEIGDQLGGGTPFIIGLSKVGDPIGGGTKEWIDYTPKFLEINYSRTEKPGISRTPELGNLNATFKNHANPSTDWRIRSGRKIRLSYLEEILFTGKIHSAKMSYIRSGTKYDNYTNLSAVDSVADLASQKAFGLGGVSEPEETFESRLERILDTFTGEKEIPAGSNYPEYILAATTYQSDLASQLDLACDSVGAGWQIDKLGQLRFFTQTNFGATLIFSDGTHTETIENYFAYYDLELDYDWRNHVNYINVTNRDIIDNPDNPGEALDNTTNYVFADTTSVESNGRRTLDLTTSLATSTGFENSIENRANEILETYGKPKTIIKKLYVNAQENFSIATLEKGNKAEIWLEGQKQILSIAGISAAISAKIWTIEIELKEV